jgi:hypothetical protein
MSGKLPVMTTLREAGQLVRQHRGDLLRVGLVFIVAFFVIGAIVINSLLPLIPRRAMPGAQEVPVDPRLPAGMLLTLVIEFLLFAIFSVGWHRVILLGPGRAGPGLGVQLGRRELRYFGRLWFCLALSIAIAFVVAFIEQFISLGTGADPEALMVGAEIAYILVSAYVFVRLGPSFAGLSIDLPLSFKQSWIATRGNGLRILAVYCLVAAGWVALNLVLGQVAYLLGLGESAPYTLLLVNALALCVLLALLVSVNAIVYRRFAASRAVV